MRFPPATLIVLFLLVPGLCQADTFERAVRRIARRMPLCGQELGGVEVKDGWIATEGQYRSIGRITQDGTMLISRQVTRRRLRYTVAHECGHLVDYALRVHGPFGSPPYVSAYARSSRGEDFAESYAHYVLWKKGSPDKVEFFRSYLQ